MWWVALNQALLSSCATTAEERSQPVRSIQRGAETVGAVAIDIGHLRALGRASTLRGVGRPVGRCNAELLGVLGVESLPAAELHRLAGNDAADGRSAEKPIQNIETNVPPGSTHRDEAAIDVGPQRQARAATKGFEFPPDILVAPVVL